MASVDVPVALLGYGTVGSAVNRLLTESADDIERATGHRLRVVKALVRDPGKAREFPPSGVALTTEIADVIDDPSIAVVAEVMGGVEPTGDYVLEALRRGKHVVSANKQLVARRGAELFAAASAAGVQLRFEASVCAAIPVIKVLRESLVVPFTIPSTRWTRENDSDSRNTLITGIAAHTLASKRSCTPASEAAANSSPPRRATSCLFAETTERPERSRSST